MLKPRPEKFTADIPEILHSQELTTDENDYYLIGAYQDKSYVAENGEVKKVSSDYINGDFQSFRSPYLLTWAYSIWFKVFHLIATLLLASNQGSIHQSV